MARIIKSASGYFKHDLWDGIPYMISVHSFCSDTTNHSHLWYGHRLVDRLPICEI